MRIQQMAWALVFSALLLPAWVEASAENAALDTAFFNNVICPGQSLFIAGNLFDAQNTMGTIVLPGASWDGTDSVVVVNLALAPPVTHVIEGSFCSNQALIVNGHIYDATHPAGTELLPGAADGGCDSLIVVDLTFLIPAQFYLQQTICNNDTVWVNNQAYDRNYYIGMETVDNGAANGCDSTILVELTVLPAVVDTFSQILCPTASITVNGAVYDRNHAQGLEILPNAAENGCDSLVYVDMSFYDPPAQPGFLGENLSVGLGVTVCLALPDTLSITLIDWSDELSCATADCASVCFWANQDERVICTITDENACVMSDTVYIEVSDTRPVYIPNVFSPEAVSPNNRFQIFSGIAGTRVSWLRVFDRWGSLIYEENGFDPDAVNTGWDGNSKGQMAQPDVYTYALELLFPDGKKEIRSGTVTLLR